MKILFIGPNSDIYNFFQYLISQQFELCVKQTDTTLTAVEELKTNSYTLIIFLIPGSEPITLFEYLKKSGKLIPILFTGDNNSISDCHKYIGHHPLTSRISFNSSEDVIGRTIHRIFNIQERRNNKENSKNKSKVQTTEGYCPLTIGFFHPNTNYKSDIFIKLSEDKFLKIYRLNDAITKSDLDKHISNGVTHFHLKSSDFLKATSGYLKTIQSKIKPAQMKTEHLNVIANFTHNSMCKMIPELGLKEEVLEMVSDALNNVKEVISRNESITEMMESTLKGRGYIAEHSIFLSYLACAIAKEIEWDVKRSTIKLTLAAFFHDVYVDKEGEILELSGDPKNDKSVSDKARTAFFNHPHKAVELVESLIGVPTDVSKILISHHERHDGSGFPHSLDWKHIIPLAAIFIVAEDFTNCVYVGGKDLSFMNEVLDDLEQKYTKGVFKKSVVGLRKALALPSEHRRTNKKSCA